MKRAAEGVLKQFQQPMELLTIGKEGSFCVDLENTTIKVSDDHAVLQMPKLDLLTCSLAFAIAKAGNLVGVTEGGKYPVVLVDESQRSNLPEESWRQPELSPVAKDALDFQKLLRSWHRVHKAFAKKVLQKDLKTDEEAGKQSASIESKPASVPIPSALVVPPPVWFYHVFLCHFSRTAYRVPKHAEVLGEFISYLDAGASVGCGITRRHPNVVWFDLPSGDGRVWGHKACIDLREIDLRACRVIWEMARIGDMAIVTHKPRGFQTILTNVNQIEHLPMTWKSEYSYLSVGHSPEEVHAVLRRHHEADLPQEKRAVFGPEVPIPLPGTEPSLHDTVYLEMLPKDPTGEKQWKRWAKFINPKLRKYYTEVPQDWGSIRSNFRLITTSAGKNYNAYSYGYHGGNDIYNELMLEFAAVEGVTTARIVNFDTLVQSDGVSCSISECKEFTPTTSVR